MTDNLVDYNKLLEDYNALKAERDAFESKIATLQDDIKARDDKIKNLNDALYDSIITRQKPTNPDTSEPEPKSFSEMYAETISNLAKK